MKAYFPSIITVSYSSLSLSLFPCLGQEGNTALTVSAAEGRAEVVDLLCQRGANIEAQTNVKPIVLIVYMYSINIKHAESATGCYNMTPVIVAMQLMYVCMNTEIVFRNIWIPWCI